MKTSDKEIKSLISGSIRSINVNHITLVPGRTDLRKGAKKLEEAAEQKLGNIPQTDFKTLLAFYGKRGNLVKCLCKSNSTPTDVIITISVSDILDNWPIK